MTDTDGMVAKAAEAIFDAGMEWKAANGGDDATWADVPGEVFARAALTAIHPGLLDGSMVVVPREPTEEMWSGLARQLVLWRDMSDNTGRGLYQHLKAAGWPVPDWLRKEIPDTNHVPAKGDVAVVIYRAMLAAAHPNITPKPADPA